MTAGRFRGLIVWGEKSTMNQIRWIQLSDLHFGDDCEYTLTSRQELKEHIKRNLRDIDYVFVTGDLIFAKNLDDPKKKSKGYAEAAAYLKDICRSLWGDADLAKNIEKRLFIVPGNHDLVQDKARSVAVNGMLDEYNAGRDGKIDPSHFRSLSTASDFFRKAYLELFSKKKAPFNKQKVHYVKETDKINVLHINTCIASSGKEDFGRLIVGFDLLSKTLSSISNKKPTIAIAHHNFDCLSTEEQKKLETLLKQHNISLYLCGHAHARESNLILRYNQYQVINTFTCGTLMADDGSGPDSTVFFVGEMDLDTQAGKIYSFKWDLPHKWHEDPEFGLTQDAGRKGNYRIFSASGLVSGPAPGPAPDAASGPASPGELRISEGTFARIVTHRSPERRTAFLEMNKRARQSLSIYGIGITSVSKEDEMLDRILAGGGTIRLCMASPEIFKPGVCGPGPDGAVPECLLTDTNFCVYGEHMNEYMRAEYYEDMRRSYKRLKDYRETAKDKGGSFEIKVLKSFIPLSINIINEDTEDAELIVEYNMPFTSKRLLMCLNQKESGDYYHQIKEIFDVIWGKAEDFTW